MIVFDMDGTLTLVGERKKYLEQTPKDWPAFLDACGEDPPNKPIFRLFFNMILNGDYLLIITGRDEKYRVTTLHWLKQYGVDFPSEQLLMRPAGDRRHDHVIKQEIVQPFKDSISVVFEDRSSVVKMWRDMGITCCQVAEGDF